MEETRRQACIEALGLTPWVARASLPGAAPSARLERSAPTRPSRVESSPAAADVATAMPAATDPVPETQPISPTEPETPSAQGSLRFTLHALATPGLLLMVQQADPDAPEPGRDEQRLLASLLRYFHAHGARPRTFAWPLPGAADEAEQARASLEAFAGRLASDHGLPRLLWLLEDWQVRTLLGGPRHETFAWQGLNNLAVASLAEMLAEPVRHKGMSWQSMVRHGFTA